MEEHSGMKNNPLNGETRNETKHPGNLVKHPGNLVKHPGNLVVSGLRKSWGSFTLGPIDLVAPSGGTLVVLGPCGAGKTLFLECLAGLHDGVEGSMVISGDNADRDIATLPPEKRRVGFVYQNYSLFPHLSVLENVTYGMRYIGVGTAETKAEIDRFTGLLDLDRIIGRKDPMTLSGGEQQKIALARALAVNPAVLLLDEPLSSLDHNLRDSVAAILKAIPAKLGIPVICVTHSHEETAILGDSVAIIMNGEILQQGSRAEVFDWPTSLGVAEFLGFRNLLPAVAQYGTTHLGPLCIKVPGAPEGPGFLAIRPHRISVTRPDRETIKPNPAKFIENSSADSIAMTVKTVENRGTYARAILAGPGFELTADVPETLLPDLPGSGEPALVSIRGGSAHFIPSESR